MSKYNGSIIGKRNIPSLLSASGVWDLDSHSFLLKEGKWPPGLLTLTTSSGVTTIWDGSTDLVLDSTEEYTVTALYDFTVLVKMWGAGGAAGFIYTGDITSTSREGPGGGGGYSSAEISFTKGQYVFQIGEGGARVPSAGTGATYLAGGVQASSGGAQGGGYSGIFKGSVVNQANALLIAGGGGGGSDTAFSAYGGAGGGTSGLPGASDDLQSGSGGTQLAGGAPSIYNGCTAGAALLGGLGQNNTESLGGGGGGYYGGGGGNVGGGGGGSSYISGDSDVSSGTTSAGSSSTPGNSSDSDRGTAGTGGVSGSTSGFDGKILLRLP